MNYSLLRLKHPNVYPWFSYPVCGVSVGKGWFRILDVLATKIDRAGISQYIVVDQIKEKFGTLRFYYSMKKGAPELAWELIDAYVQLAEWQSEIQCEECGEPGKMLTEGWWRVRCEAHEKRG